MSAIVLRRIAAGAGARAYAFPSLVLLLLPLDADGQVLHHFGVERVQLVCDRAIKLASESCGAADLGRVGLADRADQAAARADPIRFVSDYLGAT